jgi:hypothetical protein
VLGGLVYQRLRRALLPDFQRLWRRDVSRSADQLQRAIADLEQEVGVLRAGYRALTVAEHDRRDADVLAGLDASLDLDRLREHVCAAIARAPLVPEPTAHLVVAPLLPPDLYDLVLRAVPPPALFPDRDPVKQDFEMTGLDAAPELSRRVWRFLDDQLLPEVIVPALLQRFGDAVARRYAASGGPAFGEQAAAIPHRHFSGRIQLRRPGYHLRPHMDPKRVAITGLLYLARPGDDDTHGTDLFTLSEPIEASGLKTFFPEEAGVACHRASTIPYRPNTLLAFVNGGAAHGATLPPDARLRARLSYQFYIKPDDGALRRLLEGVAPDARAVWAELLDGRSSAA